MSGKRGAGCGVGGVCGVVCGRRINDCVEDGECANGHVVVEDVADATTCRSDIVTVSASCKRNESMTQQIEDRGSVDNQFPDGEHSGTNCMHDISNDVTVNIDDNALSFVSGNTSNISVNKGRVDNTNISSTTPTTVNRTDCDSGKRKDSHDDSNKIERNEECAIISYQNNPIERHLNKGLFLGDLSTSEEEKIHRIEINGPPTSSQKHLGEPGTSIECIKLEYLDASFLERQSRIDRI